MRKILTAFLLLIIVSGINPSALFAQNSGFDGVRLFQSYFQDARITNSPYVNGNFFFGDFDFVDIITLDARGGYTFKSNFEAEGQFGFVNVNRRFGGSDSGVSDIFLTGRYMFDVEGISLAGGAFFTLPIGT
ncbi:MAG: hypothetical protein ACFCU6_01580, partial [Balneolaceae bacterium]